MNLLRELLMALARVRTPVHAGGWLAARPHHPGPQGADDMTGLDELLAVLRVEGDRPRAPQLRGRPRARWRTATAAQIHWGPVDSSKCITGPAFDFTGVVTLRIHRDDTALRAVGSDAEVWLAIAQAFAGPPGEGRRPSATALGRSAAPLRER